MVLATVFNIILILEQGKDNVSVFPRSLCPQKLKRETHLESGNLS